MKPARAPSSYDPMQVVASVVHAEVDRVVNLCPELEKERVAKILWRTVYIRDPAPLDRVNVPLAEAQGILFWLQIEGREPHVAFLPPLLPYLEEEGTLPPSEILSAFETEDLNDLNHRLVIFDALKAREAFLFRLPQLAQLLRDFADHLEDNDKTLIASGRFHEGEQFDALPWLGNLLGPLYPLDPHSAPPKDGASSDDRREFLQLKIALLKASAAALEQGLPDEEFWETSLELLARHLTTTKLDRYLMLDHLHYHSEMIREWAEGADSPHSGGISCLLSAIEDFRVELRTRIMSDDAEMLGSLVKWDRQTGLPKLKVNSYFAVSQKRRSALNRALDHFDNAESHHCSFEDEFRGDMIMALRTRFSEEPGKPPVARILPYPFRHPEHVLAKARTPTKGVFRRDGDIWVIEFQGRRLPRLKDSLGLRYIHFLIQNPGKNFTAIDLYQRVTKKPAGTEENARTKVSNAITRARNEIGSEELWRHFFNCLKMGNDFRYDSRQNWDA